MEDIELLRCYADQNSEEAFATLVTRHLNLVYSVALRHVHNPHHAEEITQAVFVILARKSGQLRPGVVLSGWLYHAARLTAANFLRSETQRTRREQEAHMQSILNESEPDAWPQLAPILDAAMAGLGEKDRDAVVLRFFEGKKMYEVGAALGTNEEAAKKRVNRAVEKLRLFFTRRGVVFPAAVLTAAISSNSVQAAPAVLAKTITAAAITKGATAGGSTLTLIKGALKIMAWTKAKIAVVASVGVLLVAGTTTVIVTEIQSRSTETQPAWFFSASTAVTRALAEFRAAREKVAVNGAIRIQDARPIHDAFFEVVKMETVTVWDAAAILQAPVFTFHPEQAQLLRDRLRMIASRRAGVEAALAAALSFRLPRPATETAAESETFARAFLDHPELTMLLHSQFAGVVLEAIAGVPRKVAGERALQMMGFADQLDPVTSSSAAQSVGQYFRAVSPLAKSPDERDVLRAKIVGFISAVLANASKSPELQSRRSEIEHTLQSLTNAVARGEFVGRPAPQLNFLWSSHAGVKSLADLKGKVVVLDFWATWCGPCIESFPMTRKLAAFYRDYPVEIVGVTSPQGVVIWPDGRLIDCKDDPEKESKLIGEYQTLQNMSWTVAVSHEPVTNPDFGVPGLPYMVIIAPDGTVRHAGVTPQTAPLADQQKLIDPILREFGLKTP